MAAESLFSPHWYQVADLRVRLRPQVEIHRHRYRRQVWYVLQDHVTGQLHRFSPEAYRLIGLMDGARTLQEVWELGCAQLGDALPTQDEVIMLVARLFRANVLNADRTPDIAELQQRHRAISRRKLMQRLLSPLAVRIALWDPERFLAATARWVAPLFSRWGALLWLLLVGSALVQAGMHWSQLTDNLSDRVLSLENVLLIGVLYALIKVVHEFGHAYAVKRWGGEVHEMGVMLLVFFPVPYVDASAASAFASKYRRMTVGAAGIAVELFFAALAMHLWVLAEPGVVRALAFNVLLIGGVSTLLFNGNPLIRFDAYYVLADWLELPNLGQRANRYLAYLVKRYGCGVDTLHTPVASRSEAFWLLTYAISSYVYRLFVMVAIALFIATRYFLLGVLLALWSLLMSLLWPLLKLLRAPFSDPQLLTRRGRALGLGGATLAIGLIVLLVVPLPYATHIEAVVAAPEQALIRAPQSGFVTHLGAHSGQQVAAGTALFTLHDPVQEAALKRAVARVHEARLQLEASQGERSEMGLAREVLRFRVQEYREARARVEQMRVLSPHAGQLLLADSEQLLGRFVA